MLGPPKRRWLDRPVLVSLEALVPAGHFYRHLEGALDLTFVREWAADCYAERGRPGIDPVVFFKLQLIMFFEGLRSERRLMETVALNLAHRWYLGYALDEPLPDHSSLTRIRGRLGLPIFRRFFERVVELCRDAGLVWGEELFFDATKVRANAAIDSLEPRWHREAGAHLGQLFTADQSEPRDPAPPHQPDASWRLLDELRLDPRRPATRGYRRRSDARVSTTDPDAAPLRTGEGARLGYRDHYVVDGGRARVILAALVTPGDVQDNAPMLDLLHRVRFRWRLRPERAIADAKYGTAENIRGLEAAGLRPFVSLPDLDRRGTRFGISRFAYDPARDEYRCPQGQPLRRGSTKYTEQAVVYQASAAACNACPLKPACTTSDHGRQVYRSFHTELLDRVRALHATAAYHRAMRKRAVWVEPLFGEAKDWHGLRRFRLRRLWRVNCEALLVAAGQNLKRWLSHTGWGHRHGPAGSLAPSRSSLAPATTAG